MLWAATQCVKAHFRAGPHDLPQREPRQSPAFWIQFREMRFTRKFSSPPRWQDAFSWNDHSQFTCSLITDITSRNKFSVSITASLQRHLENQPVFEVAFQVRTAHWLCVEGRWGLAAVSGTDLLSAPALCPARPSRENGCPLGLAVRGSLGPLQERRWGSR